jgi:hypothetical protein
MFLVIEIFIRDKKERTCVYVTYDRKIETIGRVPLEISDLYLEYSYIESIGYDE